MPRHISFATLSRYFTHIRPGAWLNWQKAIDPRRVSTMIYEVRTYNLTPRSVPKFE